MNRTGTYTLIVALLVAVITAYFGMRWNMQETRWAFPPGTKLMLVAAVVIAALSRLLGRSTPLATAVVVAGGMSAGAFIAKLGELLTDPSSNNLLPVGMVVLGVTVFAAALVGVLIGSLMLRSSSRRTSQNSDP